MSSTSAAVRGCGTRDDNNNNNNNNNNKIDYTVRNDIKVTAHALQEIHGKND